jgi:hypothetical protein
VKVLCEFIDRHEWEEDMPEDGLPAVSEDLPTGWGYDPLEGVEEAILSGIDGMDHRGRNSFSRDRLSIEWRPRESSGTRM